MVVSTANAAKEISNLAQISGSGTEEFQRFAAGAKTVGTQIVGKVTKQQVEEIAKQKMPDLNCDSVESAMAQVVGSARSMGLQVVE